MKLRGSKSICYVRRKINIFTSLLRLRGAACTPRGGTGGISRSADKVDSGRLVSRASTIKRRPIGN